MGNLLNTMFSSQTSPNEQSLMSQRESAARHYDAQTQNELMKLKIAQQRQDMMNPENYANIASTFSGVPLPQVEQQQDYLKQGIPYIGPDIDPASINTINKNLASLMMLPLMTGDTNYDQFMKGFSSGRDMGLGDAVLTGEMDPNKVAMAQGAMQGKPMLDVKGSYAFNPYGSVSDVFALGGAEATTALQTREGRINDVMRTYNIDRQKATSLVDNYSRVRSDPVSGQGSIVNLAQGTETIPERPDLQPYDIPPASSSLPTGIDYSAATGPSGFGGNIANTVAGVVGGQYDPEVEKAGQGLTNLQVRTQTGLQQSIPGRPSNYLMEQMGKLTVEPYSILQGDARSFERLRQTRDMVSSELYRMENDILANPRLFSPKQIAETRENVSLLKALLNDYNTVLSGFNGQQGAGNGSPIRITSDAEYNSLPSGTTFIAPDGTTRTKP